MRALLLLIPMTACSLLGTGVNTADACGNGVIQVGLNEECDDGNNSDGDGCSSLCISENICGDGLLLLDEDCDDGNNTSGDGCDADCNDEFCGDGIVNDAGLEECDDGNTTSGDDCSALCQDEVLIEAEPNDSIGTAQPLEFIEVNARVDAALGNALDMDFFLLTLAVTTTLTIEVTEATAPDGGTCANDDQEPDTILYLFNAQNRIIAENDDDGPGNCSRLVLNRLAPGDYFIRVNDFGFQEAISDYRLEVDLLSECGDGATGINEECEPGDAGCQADCTDGVNCGDGILDIGEQCDDNNGDATDGCANCLVSVGHFFEVEPNDDARLEEGNAAIGSGDFSLDNALSASGGAPFTADVVIHGTMLINGGDEDYYLIENTGGAPALVTIETADPALGFGGQCDDTADTNIALFELSGNLLGAQRDADDDGGPGLCSLQDVVIGANETLVLQVTESGDDDELLDYLVRIDFQ